MPADRCGLEMYGAKSHFTDADSATSAMLVSPSDTNAGFNIIIVGQTGAGKSFLANFLTEVELSCSCGEER